LRRPNLTLAGLEMMDLGSGLLAFIAEQIGHLGKRKAQLAPGL
jgi:hypothetical protein